MSKESDARTARDEIEHKLAVHVSRAIEVVAKHAEKVGPAELTLGELSTIWMQQITDVILPALQGQYTGPDVVDFLNDARNRLQRIPVPGNVFEWVTSDGEA